MPAKTSSLSILLILISLLGVFPLDVILPSVPQMAEYFAVDTKRIAYSVSLFALGVALSQAVIGPLSDCVGRKRLLIAGLLVGIAGAIGCMRTTHYETFMVFRLLQAMGCGCFVLSQALVQDSYSGQQRNAMRILLTSASGVFIALSPLAGSVLQQYWGWQGSFQAFVMLAVLVLLLCLMLLGEDRASRYRGGFLPGYCQILKDRKFLVYSIFSCLAFCLSLFICCRIPLVADGAARVDGVRLLHGVPLVWVGLHGRRCSCQFAESKYEYTGADWLWICTDRHRWHCPAPCHFKRCTGAHRSCIAINLMHNRHDDRPPGCNHVRTQSASRSRRGCCIGQQHIALCVRWGR